MKVTAVLKRTVVMCLILFLAVGLVRPTVAGAKTIKKLADGGYTSDYDKAGINGSKLVIKGKVVNWERSVGTPEYSKSGTFKFKFAKNCEILDGYRDDTQTISVEEFNDLCKNPDEDHKCIAFTIKKNKVTMLRFW